MPGVLLLWSQNYEPFMNQESKEVYGNTVAVEQWKEH